MAIKLLGGLVAAAGLSFLLMVPRMHAEVRLPHFISDNAVLQRNQPLHIWGWSTPNAHLTVHFDNQSVATLSNGLGKWSLYLSPEGAGGPYTLVISGDGVDKTLKNILVGDVWIASGQSNMEFPLKGFDVPKAPLKDEEKEIAAANQPMLRLLLVEHKAADVPQEDISNKWTICTPETAKNFSAVAYFFGRAIALDQAVPIGLIDTSWGGTPADAWVSMNTLGNDPRLFPAFASRALFADQQVNLDAVLASERREDDAAKAAGSPPPQHPWHPYGPSWTPAALYNGMVAPFASMTVKGFIWYQGEANAGEDRVPYYHDLLSALIGDWRMHFAQGNLPFLFVQISSFASDQDWGLMRDQQRRTLDVANTGMAVTLDVGEPHNIHPADKQTVGRRLALAARSLAYGESIAYQGPLFREASKETTRDGKNAIRVWFDYSNGLNSQGWRVNGFELAGPDHHFVPADAIIEGDTVLVKSNSLQTPTYVRFGWNSVVPDSLYNAAGLPTSTFTSEWPPKP